MLLILLLLLLLPLTILMASSRLSLVSLYGFFIRRRLKASGLFPKTVEVDDETNIHFWGPKPSSNPTGKPPLILIHGFGPSGIFQWQYQVKSLSSHFDLYIPDLVFFGKSSSKSSERSEVFQAVSMGKLVDKLGLKRFSVMGTSYGGMVTYNMASMWPEKIEKVVIASSAVNMVRKDKEETQERAKMERIDDLMLPGTAAQLRKLTEMVLYKPPSVLPKFLLNDMLRTLYAEKRPEKFELLKGMTIGSDDVPHVSPLQVEALLVWGESDRIFPLKKAIELQELLGGKVELEVMKNASHVPQMEHPKQFNNIVKKFLC